MTKEQREALSLMVAAFQETLEHSDYLDDFLGGYFDTDKDTARQLARGAVKPARDALYPDLARAEKARSSRRLAR